MLSVIDNKWKDHLYDLDHLKASIGFRGWGQKDPLVEYKKEAYEMFVGLMDDLRTTVAKTLLKAQIGAPPPQLRGPQRLAYSGPKEPGQAVGARPAAAGPAVDSTGIAASRSVQSTPRGAVGLESGPDPRRLATNRGEGPRSAPVTVDDGPGRNDPCPCGSGKKFKKCHGRNA